MVEADLPPFFEKELDPNGDIVYYNTSTNLVHIFHPNAKKY
jgi:hypothetical protein